MPASTEIPPAETLPAIPAASALPGDETVGRVEVGAAALADAIDALLPQTQCTQCSYAGCRPYAEAIAGGTAAINQCPPGGAAGIAQLARLIGRAVLPLNPVHGTEQAFRVAVIDESLCIGCTLCIDACPVDAIVGSAKRMHSVLPHLCSGCALCVAPCPMDCIAMQPPQPARAWTRADADAARARFYARKQRLARRRQDEAPLGATIETQEAAESAAPTAQARLDHKKAAVQAAVERARQRRAGHDVDPRRG